MSFKLSEKYLKRKQEEYELKYVTFKGKEIHIS